MTAVDEVPPSDIDIDVEALDDEIDVELSFPFAPPQQWAILHPELDADAVAVYCFLMAHLNPFEGKVHAHFGRKQVAKRFGRDGKPKSLDWVDKQFGKLAAVGAMTKRYMYWIDSKKRGPHGRKSFKAFDPITGEPRAQASNKWTVRLTPPGGALFPHAIKISEYYKPEQIRKRIAAAQGGAADERPPLDQAKPDTDDTEGGAAPERPDRTQGVGKNTGRKDHTGDPPPGTPEPAADASGTNNAGRSRTRKTRKRKFARKPQTAREKLADAQRLAGPEAVAKLAENPAMDAEALAWEINQHQRDLIQTQALMRAWKLLACYRGKDRTQGVLIEME